MSSAASDLKRDLTQPGNVAKHYELQVRGSYSLQSLDLFSRLHAHPFTADAVCCMYRAASLHAVRLRITVARPLAQVSPNSHIALLL